MQKLQFLLHQPNGYYEEKKKKNKHKTEMQETLETLPFSFFT